MTVSVDAVVYFNVIDAEQAKETVKYSENKVEDSEKKETEQVSNSVV